MTLERWLRYIESVHFRSIDLALDRVSTVMLRVLPNGPGFCSISVAGTNGKGSAVEVLTSILRQTGVRVGTYTSPHLVNYTERIRIDGHEVDEKELCAAFARIEEERRETPLTYFEFGTLAALVIFEERGIDVAVLEVGMGGRLDAVNAVDAGAALITSISIDHEHWLGKDRHSIAIEKAAIFRPNKPAVCADPDPPAAIREHANSIGADFYQLGRDYDMIESGSGWQWSGPKGRFGSLRLPMEGKFQANNVAGALMVLTCIDQIVQINQEQICKGLSSLRLRGRFEIMEGPPQIVLDVAHNMAAIRVLYENLKKHVCPGRTFAVCGMLKDKPARAIGELLNPLIDEWHVGTIHDPRGRSAEELAVEISATSSSPVSSHDSVLSAFRAARCAANSTDRVLVFGSFHTVGDIIRALEGDGVLY